jgi:hypothetical protein
MSEHVTDWLNAFLDGELHELHLRQVQDHLAKCAACQAELKDLERLSQMIKKAAPAEADQPADRFIAELTLLLPRREDSTQSPSGSETIDWWLIPASAAAAWAFLQAELILSGLLSTARAAGLLDGAANLLSSGPQHTEWFTEALGLFGSHLGGNVLALLNVLDSLGVFRQDLTSQLAWQAGFGLLYWAGLIFWWTHRPRTAGQPSALQASVRSLNQPGQENPQAR